MLKGHNNSYAIIRNNGVDIAEQKILAVFIELEIDDPLLFRSYSSGAPVRFADALAKRMDQTP